MSKKIITICAVILMTASVFLPQQASAQTPQKMSYQAVIRNSSDALVTSTAVGMRISILQTTATGTAVYVETQTPTSNANGLVSLEIGAGTVVSGDFTTIDWANGPYFIKTETDLAGSTNYTITGTSQFLSVPYALHAKTAETVTGVITETDPIFGASVANGLTGTDTTNWNNKQDQLVAGTNISIVGNTISATGATTLTIGQSYQGGTIFWLDATGQHGLIAATADQSTGIRWYGGTNTNTRASADGIGAGLENTAIIIANQGPVDGAAFAATVCNEYSVTVGGVTYGDWYLPSKYELNLMYLNIGQGNALGLGNVGGFADNFYWSSTEYDLISAWIQNFNDGKQYYAGYKFFDDYYVRAVRAF